MRISQNIQKLTWELIEYRFVLSLGLSAVSGWV
jgi:hypothetical protein